MLHVCAPRFDVTENFEKFLIVRVNWAAVKMAALWYLS